MPIEIRELVIKTTVEKGASNQGASTGGGKDAKDAMIQECVDKVMDVLKDKAER